jgi:hypothetical protein
MTSLSTVYFISILTASIAGIGSAFVGNMIHPIKGGADYVPPTPADVAKATADAERATNEADKKAKELRDAEPFQKAQAPAPVPVPVPVRAPPPPPPTNLPAVTAVRTEEENDAKELEEAVNQLKTDS